MDATKKKYVAVALVAIVAVAAIAVGIVVMNNNNNGNDKTTVSFLVTDNQGVYFWMDGKTNKDGSVLNALEDATKTFDIPMEKSSSAKYGEGIKSIFGLATVQDADGNYTYWYQTSWQNGEWTKFGSYISSMKASECRYVSLNYSDGKSVPSVTPTDAVPITSNLNGYKFLIESPSGLHFEVSATGNNAYDAAKNCFDKYKMPYEMNTSNVNSIFGLEMKKISDDVWNYWAFYTYNNSTWGYSSVNLDKITDTTNFIGFIYGDGSKLPVAP